MKAAIDVFNEKWIPEPFSGCWLWSYGTGTGYGWFTYRNASSSAHRASWALYKGPIPDGAWVLHECDTPLCVNPNHLRLGSALDNSRDMIAKGRHRSVPPRLCGVQAGMAKLDDDSVKTIRASNRPLRELARYFKVDPKSIWNVKTLKTWRHVK